MSGEHYDEDYISPTFEERLRQGIAEADRGETFHVYPRWKRIFNPYRRILFAWRHRFGKWKNL